MNLPPADSLWARTCTESSCDWQARGSNQPADPSRVSRTERKRDTRRKIVLGGAILAALDHEGVPAIRTRADLERWLDTELSRPQDRRVFGLATHATA